MSKSTFKILFYIRKNQVNKDGTVCIMVRLTVSGDVTQFSSKLNVDPKAWDVRLGKVAGNSVKARQLNDLIKSLKYLLTLSKDLIVEPGHRESTILKNEEEFIKNIVV